MVAWQGEVEGAWPPEVFMGEEISNRKGSFGRHTSARFVVVVGSCKGAKQWRKGVGCREEFGALG
jgi:hypothetical protein